MDELPLRRLLDVGRSLVEELDQDLVLERLLEVARELTGARYAAIGVLDPSRESLERFITKGIDEATHRAIGDLPRGRGVLGALIDDPRPLRLEDVGAHPASYGFPLGHPPMHAFLGVPIVVQDEAWGNLYLTEKADGPFTQADEDAIGVLADWAAIAITNARLYRDVRNRHDELERANRGLETTTEIARALGGETDVERVLELVVKRSRALLDARAAAIALLEETEDGTELIVEAVAGSGVADVRGQRLPIERSISASAMRLGRTQRFAEVPDGTVAQTVFGARTALATPMMFRTQLIGVLTVFDRLGEDPQFTEEHERLLEAFAASAATAVATAQTASGEALRRSVEASEQERRRWARELHDETLQELAGIRMLLSGARRAEGAAGSAAVDAAIERVSTAIANLRALITELRPASLDEIGLAPAVHALVERVQATSGMELTADVSLAFEAGTADARLDPELEVVAYRFVQEALTNAVKHARATCVGVRVEDADGTLLVEVRDDGAGFEPAAATAGFGLLGMRERIELVQGELDIDSAAGAGTTLTVRIPVRRRTATGPQSV
jgi:signal transduction histidine kinase